VFGTVALWLLGGGLCSWVVLTVLNAVPALSRRVNRVVPGVLQPLIPSWNFFAPNPATSDHALLYRDLLEGDTFGPWRQVWTFRPKSPLVIFWDPTSRPKKAASDAVSYLMQLARDEDAPPEVAERDARLMVSIPYLLLLNRVVNADHDVTAVACQFAVAAASLRDELPRVIFVSEVHRLDLPAGAIASCSSLPSPRLA